MPVIVLKRFHIVTHTYPASFLMKTHFSEAKNIFYVKN